MVNRKDSTADIILAAHFLGGVVFGLFPALVLYFTFIVFIYFTYKSFNAVETAGYGAAYIVGLEMLMRLSRSSVPHEFAKYAVCVILLPGIFKKRALPIPIIIYGLVQVPAFFLADGGDLEATRQLISFNFSGPLCLVFSTIYFYNKPMDESSLRRIFLHILYPIAAILGFLLIRTPSVEEITFGFSSNIEASSYGPNQVASILGLSILIFGFCYIFKIRLFQSYITFFVFLLMAAYRGLLTFSRGGMAAPIIILIGILVYLYFGTRFRFNIKVVVSILVLAAIVFFSFEYVNDLTQNALYRRYSGEREKGVVSTAKYTSGRSLILAVDWEIFKANPVLGVGTGMGKYYREKYLGQKMAAHIEYSRLLAENGVLGLLALFLLLWYPIKRFFEIGSPVQRSLLLACVGFCLTFMAHSATRIAAPCFVYGLAFVTIVWTNTNNKRKLINREVNEPAKSIAGN